jgi:hypothetical protein
MSDTPAEVLRLLTAVGLDPRLRRITIQILQGLEKEAEANTAVRDIVNDLRVPPSAQAPGPTERVTLAGIPVVTEYRGADQRGWYDPPSADAWKPPGQSVIDRLTETSAERAKRTGGAA